ncbi:dimethylallyltransferase [Methyloprofundus sedimenti]|uniref:Dimethylallyltransferase n=1 Tax=Methyloprofundus sedimenti TaxID=1420851 RepID=A0A1V8M5W1_9GAMM|nr:type 1 glutamine amidotransferase domain-containing protein [Methyloprofundus sedimenti]OQK16937.1 dimethylallyltransferase [Methyloprofundus sedimenti]
MKILMILTSHDQLGDTGMKTGFWLEEFAAPYYIFQDANAEITLASPKGGLPPLDPKSDDPAAQTEVTQRFKNDPEAQVKLANTLRLEEISAEDYDAVFYPGGHGPLWDLSNNADSIAIIELMYAAGKPVAAVCHAPAVLLHAKSADNKPLIQGKSVTGFSNTEEAAVQLTNIVPFLLEDSLKAKGANYAKIDNWQSYAVTDGNLVTGQNPGSSAATAKAVLELLQENHS